MLRWLWKKTFVFSLILFATLINMPFTPQACSWDYPIWQKSKKSDVPLFRFIGKTGLAGYIDKAGNVAIPPKYRYWGNHGGDFFNGRAIVATQKDDELIDATGKTLAIVDKFKTSNFSEGLAAVRIEQKNENGFKTGFINLDGKLVITDRFDEAHSFSEGLAVAETENRYGYIDKSGKYVIQPEFLKGWSFSEGFARVIRNGPCYYWSASPCPDRIQLPHLPKLPPDNPRASIRCEYSFISKEGQLLTPQTFREAKDFSEGLAPVRQGDLWDFIDKTGKLKIPYTFNEAELFSEGLAAVAVGDFWGFINDSGQFVIQPQFKFASWFSEGLAVAGKLEKGKRPYWQYWFIDKSGKQAFPGLFDAASFFVMERAHVQIGNKWSYIDQTGKAVFTYELPREIEER